MLVTLGDYEEALVVAERGRTRAFVDLLVERQNVDQDSWYSSIDSTPVTKDQIMEIVNRQRSAVLYYSIAAGYLYSWLILPERGTVICLYTGSFVYRMSDQVYILIMVITYIINVFVFRRHCEVPRADSE